MLVLPVNCFRSSQTRGGFQILCKHCNTFLINKEVCIENKRVGFMLSTSCPLKNAWILMAAISSLVKHISLVLNGDVVEEASSRVRTS